MKSDDTVRYEHLEKILLGSGKLPGLIHFKFYAFDVDRETEVSFDRLCLWFTADRSLPIKDVDWLREFFKPENMDFGISSMGRPQLTLNNPKWPWEV